MRPIVSLFIFYEITKISLVIGSLEVPVQNNAFDKKFYEEVLDAELCDQQIRLIKSNPLVNILFADAGIRVPRGIFQGNNVDLGNYYQCLGINQELSDQVLQGKYCMINVPINQNLELPQFPELLVVDLNSLRLDNDTTKLYENLNSRKLALQALTGNVPDHRSLLESPLAGLAFRLAVCIPKPCSTQQAINSFLFNISAIGFQYNDEFCRLPDDKPWVPGDYILIVVFAVLGLLTILSTSYDLWHTFIAKKDAKTASVIGKSFSVYTNGRRIMNFTSGPGSLECLDGIRSLSIAWVIIVHTFTVEPLWANPIEGFMWQRTYGSLWVTGAHLAVDTFFALSGLLVIYTTVGKLNQIQLFKNIHLFYLNRLLRMFPLLATAVLIEATYLHRMADGPLWNFLAVHVESCRANWWSTLLHMQNFATPGAMCMGQTWYLAIDIQLHLLSPMVLVFVLSGNRKVAWGGLIAALLGIMISSTTFNFIKEFPSSVVAPGREQQDMMLYAYGYYFNTLPRAPPFFVGMVFGYLIHLSRETKVEMSKIKVTILWVVLFCISTFIMYSNYLIIQEGWDNQTMDSLYNSFVRPAWAFALCAMIYACVNGYGGPINWFLSLQIWKLPARISYAMYLYHYLLILAVDHTAVAPLRFSVAGMTFKFLSHYALCFVVSFIMTLVVDSPFSTIFKQLLGPGPKKASEKKILDEEEAKQQGK